MRLQKILQFFARSRPASEVPLAQPEADAAHDAAPARGATRRHRALDKLALQTAIIHHLEWCVLFNEHLSADAAGQTPLTPLPNTADSGLGLWLDAVREASGGSDAQIDELGDEHRRFHQLAQQALAHARQGRMDLASTLLNTDFERSRARVLELLRCMQKT
jgi:hypothetical protein